MTDELNVALYSTVPFTVRPVFAASRSAISRNPCASTAPALVPSPHRMAVTTFSSVQSGVMVKSNVFVLVTSAGAVTPASTPMIAADIAAMHAAIRSGIAASGRSRSRRRIVARIPRVPCCPCGTVRDRQVKFLRGLSPWKGRIQGCPSSHSQSNGRFAPDCGKNRGNFLPLLVL